MFSKALATVAQYTRPVIVSTRFENQEVNCGMGTFIVVNNEGWALTAAHIVAAAFEAEKHKKERADYSATVAAINANETYSSGKKKHEINKLVKNWKWITNHSLWWGADDVTFTSIHVDPQADLAIAHLTGPIDTLAVKTYPTFADPAAPIQQGTSLCRLGFPFYEIKALFEQTTNRFSIPDLPQLAMFPNDGIMTRNVAFIDQPTNRQIHFLETSTAGLRGQSGGPIFDVNANIWALQSRTQHLPLGFAPKVKFNGKEVTEHQFMHVGWGVHVSHIRDLFDKHNVKFQSV